MIEQTVIEQAKVIRCDVHVYLHVIFFVRYTYSIVSIAILLYFYLPNTFGWNLCGVLTLFLSNRFWRRPVDCGYVIYASTVAIRGIIQNY